MMMMTVTAPVHESMTNVTTRFVQQRSITRNGFTEQCSNQ